MLYEIVVGTRSAPKAEQLKVFLSLEAETSGRAVSMALAQTRERLAAPGAEIWIERLRAVAPVSPMGYKA